MMLSITKYAFLKIIFILCLWLSCLSVCAPHIFLVHLEARRGLWEFPATGVVESFVNLYVGAGN